MYGLVNKAAQDFIISNFDEATWAVIKEKAGVTDAAFVGMQPYPDEVTYNIVGAACEHLNLNPEAVLESFGKYWIEFTMVEGYGDLLVLAGKSFPEFLNNLDNMHAHIAQTYTELQPPSFSCVDIDEHSFHFEYHTFRPGLVTFVKGLILGLADRFGINASVEYIGLIDGNEHSHQYLVKYS